MPSFGGGGRGMGLPNIPMAGTAAPNNPRVSFLDPLLKIQKGPLWEGGGFFLDFS